MELPFDLDAVYLLFASWIGATHGSAPTAKTRNGTYTGIYLPEFEQDVFLGVPYANAPRLENPQSLVEGWAGTRPAAFNGDACLALVPQEIQDIFNISVSDDCLNLKIVRPSGRSQKDPLLPVVVWIYGGGFATGFNVDSNTNTSCVIQASVENGTPIMSVHINYRLGFFGFPGGHQAAAAGITNLGLKDQRLALAWIQENIAGFGGDPDKVTLWGQRLAVRKQHVFPHRPKLRRRV